MLHLLAAACCYSFGNGFWQFVNLYQFGRAQTSMRILLNACCQLLFYVILQSTDAQSLCLDAQSLCWTPALLMQPVPMIIVMMMMMMVMMMLIMKNMLVVMMG